MSSHTARHKTQLNSQTQFIQDCFQVMPMLRAESSENTNLTEEQIDAIIENGKFLPHARGPEMITTCDVCRKSHLRRSIAYKDYDICLNCVLKHK